jgi:hypothetical protein
MTTFTITLDQLAPSFSKLPKRLKTAVFRGALRGAMRAVQTLQRATSIAPPASDRGSPGAVHTGQYKRSWRAERTTTGARVYNSAGYAAIIEYGRRAGSRLPPTTLIARWAQRKLRLSPKQAAAAAFPIAKAIAKRGLRGRKVMTNMIPTITKGFVEEVQKELQLEMAKK